MEKEGYKWKCEILSTVCIPIGRQTTVYKISDYINETVRLEDKP